MPSPSSSPDKTAPVEPAAAEGDFPTILAGLPSTARKALYARTEPDAQWRELGDTSLPRPVRRFTQGTVVLEVALGDVGRLRINREVHGRAWASGIGIDTAEVYDVDPGGSWLVGEWLPASSAGGPTPDSVDEYLAAALATAAKIAESTPPEPGPPPARWRSPRRTKIARALRGVAAGLPTRLWWSTRKAVEAVPTAPVTHGDFYHRNLLWRPGGVLCVVDWEYLGPGPRYSDQVRLWTILPERSQRDTVREALLASAPAGDHGDIALLMLWYSLRLIGENVKTPRAHQNPADIAHAWSVLPEAREIARAAGVHP